MNENAAESSGFDIKGFLKTLTQRPGVYKMLDEQHKVIYIGKAKNLKNRVSSYFRVRTTSPKQQVMVQRIAAIEVTSYHCSRYNTQTGRLTEAMFKDVFRTIRKMTTKTE